jgi:hypothetical protein
MDASNTSRDTVPIILFPPYSAYYEANADDVRFSAYASHSDIGNHRGLEVSTPEEYRSAPAGWRPGPQCTVNAFNRSLSSFSIVIGRADHQVRRLHMRQWSFNIGMRSSHCKENDEMSRGGWNSSEEGYIRVTWVCPKIPL